MDDNKWFHGHLSRQKAEEYLQNAGLDGSFVVRSSESILGAYALSVLFNKTVHTYRVLPTETGLLAVQTLNGVQQRKFKTIYELVHKYKSPQNGLICALTNPVGPTPTPAPPKLPAFDAPSPPVRSDPLSYPPAAAASTAPLRVGLNMGVKVIPTEPHRMSPGIQNSDLPPVPNNRENPMIRAGLKPSLPPESPKSKEAEIQSKFVSRLAEIKAHCPEMSMGYFDSVHQYASDRGLLADLASVKRGGSQCAELQTLLAKEAVAFQSEMEHFLMKIDVLRQLFDFGSSPRASNYNRNGEDVDLDTFLGRLGDCQAVVKSLNRRACGRLADLSGTGTPKVNLPRKQSRVVPPLTERIFEVKQEGALKMPMKQRLKLDVTKGRLHVMKGDGTSNEYDHTQVLQIIKNNKSKTKLAIVFEGNKKREYAFDQSAHREAFCQLLQYIRNRHSSSAEPDCVSLFVGTWNMGDAIPPSDISSWFMCQGSGRCLDDMVSAIPHDIYVVGTQETGPPEKDWMHKCIDTVAEITGKNFHMVAMDALWHIKILIFVKEEHKNRISHVKTSSVKTGIANALGNKGAVGVSFQFGGTSFCFINAHLTSGAEKCVRRNNNYVDIMRQLNLGEDRFRDFDLSNRFDHLYFLGDLNYRLEMDVQEILSYVKRNDFSTLSKVDQLRREKDSNKVFAGFCEDEVLFPPTYRYERGTREAYSHLKVKKTGIRINNPSWCDRVLWRSYPETHSQCLAYGCSDDIMTSDHSPVFSNYQVGVRGQYVSKAGLRSSPDYPADSSSISFENVEVILKAPGKSSFYLQFHSVCLTKYIRSKRSNRFETKDLGQNYVRIGWSKDCLQQLKPIIADREYLVDQHILVSVRAEDDNEVHAECVLALRSMIGTDPQMFEERLTRKGDDTGQIKGRMLVKPGASSRAIKEKTYDFIQFGGFKDEDGKQKPHIIEEAPLYGAVSDLTSSNRATPPITNNINIPPFRARQATPTNMKGTKNISPEVAVYVDSPGIEEGTYANPDELSATSPGAAPPTIPSVGGSPTFPVLSDRVMSNNHQSVGLYAPAESVRPPWVKQQQTAPDPEPMQRQAPTPAPSRPAPNPRGVTSSPPVSNMTSSPPVNLSATSPIAHYRPSVATKKRMVDDTLAEFDEIEGIFRDFEKPPVPSVAQHRVPSPGYDTPRFRSAPQHPGQRKSTAGKPPVPTSVAEFLSWINLPQYAPLLHDNGWDSIEFLGDMTEEDLNDAGVTNQAHRRMILDQIQTLSL